MKNIYLSFGHQGKGTGASHTFVVHGKIRVYDESVEAQRLQLSVMSACDVDFIKAKPMSLTETIKDVNRKCKKGDVAIELHFNASGTGKGTGVEAIVAENASALSRHVASETANIVADTLGLKLRGSNGVKTDTQSARGKLGFVRQTKCAAVILEVCFIDNFEDMVNRYEKNFDRLVEALAKYITELKTRA